MWRSKDSLGCLPASLPPCLKQAPCSSQVCQASRLSCLRILPSPPPVSPQEHCTDRLYHVQLTQELGTRTRVLTLALHTRSANALPTEPFPQSSRKSLNIVCASYKTKWWKSTRLFPYFIQHLVMSKYQASVKQKWLWLIWNDAYI